MNTGFFAMRSTCRKCGGDGTIIGSPCGMCGGEGTKKETKTITVTIPPGVDTNDTIRIPNQGNSGRFGGKAGNLYLRVHV